MRLEAIGKANVALGAIGAVGCLLGLAAAVAELKDPKLAEMVGREGFRIYLEAYLLGASLCSMAFIAGGIGLLREARWGRAASVAGGIVLLAVLVAGNAAGRIEGIKAGWEGGGSNPAGSMVSVAVQGMLGAYAIFVIIVLSRRASKQS